MGKVLLSIMKRYTASAASDSKKVPKDEERNLNKDFSRSIYFLFIFKA